MSRHADVGLKFTTRRYLLIGYTRLSICNISRRTTRTSICSRHADVNPNSSKTEDHLCNSNLDVATQTHKGPNSMSSFFHEERSFTICSVTKKMTMIGNSKQHLNMLDLWIIAVVFACSASDVDAFSIPAGSFGRHGGYHLCDSSITSNPSQRQIGLYMKKQELGGFISNRAPLSINGHKKMENRTQSRKRVVGRVTQTGQPPNKPRAPHVVERKSMSERASSEKTSKDEPKGNIISVQPIIASPKVAKVVETPRKTA